MYKITYSSFIFYNICCCFFYWGVSSNALLKGCQSYRVSFIGFTCGLFNEAFIDFNLTSLNFNMRKKLNKSLQPYTYINAYYCLLLFLLPIITKQKQINTAVGFRAQFSIQCDKNFSFG